MHTRLPSVFRSMSASYKAYWFIGILECVNEEGLTEIPIRKICARMLANAWYPVHFFRLNYGLQDLISRHNFQLMEYAKLPADVSKRQLIELFSSSSDKIITQLVTHFRRQVTYRFLSPWITYTTDAAVERESMFFTNDAPYSIDRANDRIIINPMWFDYLKDNYAVLLDFCYWNLANYLQTRNAGVPDIPGKLIKPVNRQSLSEQRKFWEIVFEEKIMLTCIYSRKNLFVESYAVEHYIPWSYTAHNQLWNLIPADNSINSSKGNRIPSAEFLKEFTEVQKIGIETVYHKKPNHKLFEDYAIFGISVSEMLRLSKNDFQQMYSNQILPQLQLAKQLGFQLWQFP